METAVVKRTSTEEQQTVEVAENVLEIRVKRTPFGLSLNGVFLGLGRRSLGKEVRGKGRGRG